MQFTRIMGAVLLMTLFIASGLVFAADKPKFDVDWYGFFKLDGSYDQNLTSNGNYAMWVEPQINGENDEQFNMTANETRLGLHATSAGYEHATVEGKVEFDLYGAASAENKAALLLRHAYFSVQSGHWQLLAGQTWDLISPLNPSTLNYPVLWGCGNIGYRRPQVRLSYIANPNEQTKVTVAAGFFRTIGSDLTPTFTLALGETSEGSDDGTDAGIPSIQGSIDIQHKLASGTALRFGVSGLWGQLKAETNFNNSQTYESRGINGHVMLSMPNGFGISGEGYAGSNLGSYFGGILNSNTVDGVNTKGGWGSIWLQASPKIKITGGMGYDDPDDADLSDGSRSQNQCIFGNIKYSFIPQVTVGLEIAQWDTKYKNSDDASNLRAQTSFVLNF